MPLLCEIEWRITSQLAEWAEVGTYNAPGVGGEPPPERFELSALVARGVEEIEHRGWERCLIVGDEHGSFPAAEIAAAAPDRVAGLALGHACLSYRQQGERAPIRGEVIGAFNQMARLDYRSYARALTQITLDGYDDQTAEEYIRRVPQEVTLAYLPALEEYEAEGRMEPLLRGLERQLLLAKHEGCLVWTDEGFEDAVTAFPEASTLATPEKPSVSPAFAEALREFCAGLDWER